MQPSAARNPASADARCGENGEAAAFSGVTSDMPGRSAAPSDHAGPATRALRDLTFATTTSWSIVSAAMGPPRATNIKELEQRVASEREVPSGIRAEALEPATSRHSRSEADDEISDDDDDGSAQPVAVRDSGAFGNTPTPTQSDHPAIPLRKFLRLLPLDALLQLVAFVIVDILAEPCSLCNLR